MPGKMLNGTFFQSMDVKGRMSFPTKLREIIGENFVITKGLTGCLFAYSLEDFEKLAEKLSDMPMARRLLYRDSLWQVLLMLRQTSRDVF